MKRLPHRGAYNNTRYHQATLHPDRKAHENPHRADRALATPIREIERVVRAPVHVEDVQVVQVLVPCEAAVRAACVAAGGVRPEVKHPCAKGAVLSIDEPTPRPPGLSGWLYHVVRLARPPKR